MEMWPAGVPHVQDEIERVVSDVNVGDAIAASSFLTFISFMSVVRQSHEEATTLPEG